MRFCYVGLGGISCWAGYPYWNARHHKAWKTGHTGGSNFWKPQLFYNFISFRGFVKHATWSLVKHATWSLEKHATLGPKKNMYYVENVYWPKKASLHKSWNTRRNCLILVLKIANLLKICPVLQDTRSPAFSFIFSISRGKMLQKKKMISKIQASARRVIWDTRCPGLRDHFGSCNFETDSSFQKFDPFFGLVLRALFESCPTSQFTGSPSVFYCNPPVKTFIENLTTNSISHSSKHIFGAA